MAPYTPGWERTAAAYVLRRGWHDNTAGWELVNGRTSEDGYTRLSTEQFSESANRDLELAKRWANRAIGRRLVWSHRSEPFTGIGGGTTEWWEAGR
ncbi:hypothetical protein ACFVUW_30025 [Streptomyces xiamenensis]|uniref:hypothetical protein n=1 Tax=Streptomyces xiamenensis TaxID=408015 RepID=UPI0036F189EC